MPGRTLALSAVLLASCMPRSSSAPSTVPPPPPGATQAVAATPRPAPPPVHDAGTSVRPEAGAAAEASPTAPPPVDAGRGADAEAAVPVEAGAAPATATPTVEVEKPRKLYERTRPKGAVYAAGRDQVLARWNVGGTGDPSFISNHHGYHPWPRVRVDTKILSRNLPRRAPWNRRRGRRRHVLSVARVQAEARAKGYWKFRLCSEDGLRRDQKMHGQTILRFSITPHGHVTHAWLVKSKLTDKDVKSCLRHAVSKLAFKPAPHRRVDVQLSVKLWPGDAPVPLIGAPDPDKAPDNPGQLDAAAIQKATADVPAAVRSCYRNALERDPHLWGRIQLRVDLDKKGRVQHVAQDESHFPAPAVVRCAVAALGKCHFPPAKGGALSFVYALRLGALAPLPATNSQNQ